MTPINVLISLHKGYGLGDAVQMSSVLRHVTKHRPHWIVDFQAEEGRHCVGCGIVANTFAYGQQPPDKHYDAEVQIVLYDRWYGWTDRPNTRVSSCLHERFGLAWDAECAGYYIEVSEGARVAVEYLVKDAGYWTTRGVVAIHYEGDTAKDKKNLTLQQAMAICETVARLGRVPLLLDWRDKSPITGHVPHMHGPRVYSTGRLCPLEWGGDAEMNTAIIEQCEAFVGIDSGPGKCASATGTPSLIVWTGHHPAAFHDPAPNTIHLVPSYFHSLAPVRDHIAVVEWFDAHYQTREYGSDPVLGIKAWLEETLR